jgi:MFS transporter, OPA family, sugar phosphate sensor protein UhpC
MLAISLCYGLSYTCSLGIGVVKKPLIDANIFSAADLGLIGSALFYFYAFGKLTNALGTTNASKRSARAAWSISATSRRTTSRSGTRAV